MEDARYISPSVVINGGKDTDGPYGIPEIAKLIEERQKFRAIQDWEKADKIRSTLEGMGFSVQDSCSGVTTLGKTEEKKYVEGTKDDIGAEIRRLVKKRKIKMLSELFQNSAVHREHINSGNINRKTALHVASQWCSTEMVELLIKYGADVNKLASRGQSALCFAISKKRYSTVKYLIEVCGASCKLRTVLMETPAQMAQLTCHDRQDIVQLVMNREAEEDKKGIKWVDYTNNAEAIRFQVKHALHCKNCQAKILIARKNCNNQQITKEHAEVVLPWIIEYEKFRLKEENKEKMLRASSEMKRAQQRKDEEKSLALRNKALLDWVAQPPIATLETPLDTMLVALVYRMVLTGKAQGADQKVAYEKLVDELSEAIENCDALEQLACISNSKPTLVCTILNALNDIAPLQQALVTLNMEDITLNACTTVKAARKSQRSILKLIMGYLVSSKSDTKWEVEAMNELEDKFVEGFSKEYKKQVLKFIRKFRSKSAHVKCNEVGNNSAHIEAVDVELDSPYIRWQKLYCYLREFYEKIQFPKQYTRRIDDVDSTVKYLDLRIMHDETVYPGISEAGPNMVDLLHAGSKMPRVNNVFWIDTIQKITITRQYFEVAERNICDGKYIHVGIDSEFSNNEVDGCAVIQVAVNNHVFCIDTTFRQKDEAIHSESIKFLKYLFETACFLKIVFAFRNDWKELSKYSNQFLAKSRCKSFVDIQDVVMQTQQFKDMIANGKRQPGLSDVVSTFLGVPLDKREQCSNWERRPLSRLQLIYAALDAVVLLDLLHAMYLSYSGVG